jgi:hypothetical protein
MNHTATCIANFAQHEAELAAYQERWPEHCQACRGHGGGVIAYDPSPAGVSLSQGCMYDFEPCPECYDKGICPRCAKPMVANMDEDLPANCPHCGWKQGQGAPGAPECDCWALDIPVDY